MLVNKKYFVILLPLFVFLGCATGQQTDRAYQEIGRSSHFLLKADGLIVGFEKIKFNNVKDSRKCENCKNSFYSNLVEPIESETRLSKSRNKLFHFYTNFNSKVMIPTQIALSVDGAQEFKYNAYEDYLKGSYDYAVAYEKLAGTFRDIGDSRAGAKRYTHIIVMNMGWNNDQAESMWRYNKIIDNFASLAKDENPDFEPFYVTITWPSVWRSISDFTLLKKLFHLISYPNKTLDADELGLTWMNWIVNDQLASLLKESNFDSAKLVLIGHSLGARILTRAVFSAQHLLFSKNSDTVDLMVGLQPAFSARRFVKNSGIEAHPYDGFKNNKTKFVFTTSVYDSANPVANYVTGAKHLGGKPGLKYARKHSTENDDELTVPVFKISKWLDRSNAEVVDNDSVLLLDASEIVKGSSKPDLTAHNDILDEDMAKLIWHYIQKL